MFGKLTPAELFENSRVAGSIDRDRSSRALDRVKVSGSEFHLESVRKKPDGSWEPTPSTPSAQARLQPIADYLRGIAKLYNQPAKRGGFP